MWAEKEILTLDKEVYLKINLKHMENALIGLKELRENAGDYIAQIQKGKTFIVMRRSRPVFKISPTDDCQDFWEPVVDFTKIKKGGVPLKSLLSRI